MDAPDSQLSDLLRQGRVADSQEIEGNTTQEMSQGTFQKIIDGQFTPLLSQNSEDLLTKEIGKSPRILRVFHDILGNEKTGERDGSGPSTSYFGSARQPGLKRRTPRIHDKSSSREVMEKKMTDLNLSRDFFYEDNDSILLNESIVSSTTLSQITCGSQKIEYLRDRTPEEQEMRNQRKRLEELEPIEEKPELDMNPRGQTPGEESLNMPSMDYELVSQEILSNSIDEAEQKKCEEEKEGMNIRVAEERVAKVSDLAYLETDDNGKHLWARMNSRVPIVLKWKVNSQYNTKQLWLRVRFVHYINKEDVEHAISHPATDVQKCLNHIDEEVETPRESFFYIKSDLTWQCGVWNEAYPKGYQFFSKLDPGTIGVEFDLVFKCQKNCMTIEDKRKRMCLAVFLEDENRNDIAHAVIEDIRICGYPKRDLKNFCDKVEEFHFPENSSFKTSSNVTPKIGKVPSALRQRPKAYRPPELMFSRTNLNQMLPSTSNHRKRGASDIDMSIDAVDAVPKSTEYTRRIHGCTPKPKHMDYAYENQPSSSKRSRQSHFSFKSIQLSEEEYRKVVKFLARDAIETQKQLAPVRYQSINSISVGTNDSVERFFALFGMNYEAEQLKKYQILSLADLIREFENDNEVFEKVGIDSSRIKECYSAFLSFYRIHEGEKLCVCGIRKKFPKHDVAGTPANDFLNEHG